MKFDITVGGQHKAQVSVEPDGKGAFTGTIVSPEFGTGAITSGVQTGNHLAGSVTLDNHDADFEATLAADAISGKLSYGWFFSMEFTGAAVA